MGILLSERFPVRGRRFSRYVDSSIYVSTSYLRWGGGGGGIYVCAAPTGMVWGHFGLESGTVFDGTTGACERQKKKIA